MAEPRHVLHVFPGFEVGGSQTRTAAWINGLGSGFRHTIVALNGRTDCRDRLEPDIDVRFPLPPPSGSGPVGRLIRIRRFLRRMAPDVLITNNWGSIEWALVGHSVSRPVLLHVESGFSAEEAERDFRRRAVARRLALSGRTRVVVPSRQLQDRALHGWGLDPGRVLLVPDGIDCALFAGSARIPSAEGVPTIGTVAVLRPEKRLDLLVDAFAVVRASRPAKLVIVGDGPERPALERQVAAAELGEDIIFTGYMQDVENAYPAFDVFALSSDTEQTPNTLMQAMAASLPAVATAVGDVPVMVAEENAPFIVPRRDVNALASALARLVRDEALRRSIGAANQRRAFAAYDMRRMIDAYRFLLA
jgi:glycosyltransferase involved in cell wall biosynthesis